MNAKLGKMSLETIEKNQEDLKKLKQKYIKDFDSNAASLERIIEVSDQY